MQKSQIAFKLSGLAGGTVIVARMGDEQVGPGDIAAETTNRRQDLFVNAKFESNFRMVSDQLDVIDDGQFVVVHTRTVHPNHKTHLSGVGCRAGKLAGAADHIPDRLYRRSPSKRSNGRTPVETTHCAAPPRNHPPMGSRKSAPPNAEQISGVPSVDPVSTMIISSTQGRMLLRVAAMVDALSRTIMHNETPITRCSRSSPPRRGTGHHRRVEPSFAWSPQPLNLPATWR